MGTTSKLRRYQPVGLASLGMCGGHRFHGYEVFV
jgi:hypothetical protein